jgi:hypothetical protein
VLTVQQRTPGYDRSSLSPLKSWGTVWLLQGVFYPGRNLYPQILSVRTGDLDSAALFHDCFQTPPPIPLVLPTEYFSSLQITEQNSGVYNLFLCKSKDNAARSFYGLPEHHSCHEASRRMQACYAMEPYRSGNTYRDSVEGNVTSCEKETSCIRLRWRSSGTWRRVLCTYIPLSSDQTVRCHMTEDPDLSAGSLVLLYSLNSQLTVPVDRSA